MSRPTTKPDLIEAANSQLSKMWGMVDSLPEEAKTASFNFGEDFKGKEAHWERDKNMRDVYIHLYEWHQLLLNWVSSNMNGDTKPFLPEPYTWKTYALMNVGFWQMHQNTKHEDSIAMLKQSHADVIALIESFSNDELFSKKHFTWTGTSTLGSYCVSATSSHYDWAMKKIKQHKKSWK